MDWARGVGASREQCLEGGHVSRQRHETVWNGTEGRNQREFLAGQDPEGARHVRRSVRAADAAGVKGGATPRLKVRE